VQQRICQSELLEQAKQPIDEEGQAEIQEVHEAWETQLDADLALAILRYIDSMYERLHPESRPRRPVSRARHDQSAPRTV
jgi:hypothetical protein